MPGLLELCGGVLTPPPVEEVRPDSQESWMRLLHRVRHMRSVLLLTLQSLPRLSPVDSGSCW
jgi:hypothetical protein